MKVRELIIELLKFPLSADVVLTEGNDPAQRTPCGSIELGCFFPEEGEFYQVDSCYAPEDGCVRSVCLGPAK